MLEALIYYIQRFGICVYLFVVLSTVNTVKILFAYLVIMFNMPSNAWHLSDEFFEYEEPVEDEQ